MGNDVKLKITGDVSELEKAFSALVRKIQSDADKLKLAPSKKSTEGPSGSQPFQQAFQASREQATKVRAEKDGIEIATRALAQKKRQLDEIAKAEKASINNEKEKAYWTDRRNKAESDYNNILNTRGRLQKNVQSAPATAGGGGGAPGSGGAIGSMPKGGINSLSGLATSLGVPGAVIAGTATTIAASMAGESLRKFFSESSLRARSAESSVFNTQGQGGQRLQALLSGGAAEEMTFNPQRLQGAALAQSAINARYAAGGVNNGSPLGSLLGGVFGSDAVGAFQHGKFSQGFRALGGRFGNEGLQKEFAQTKAQEQADLQKEQTEALKRGPEGSLRTSLSEKYLREYQQNLDFQRSTGLKFESFRGPGGFIPSINSAGFTDQQGMGMSSGILGAGGSTRSAVGSAAIGLQAQRQLDITNAGSVLGKLSGSLGGAGITNESFVKLLAEGTRVGLDGSEYREENRRFVEAAASVVSQSGTTGTAGIDQVLSQFSRFFGGDKTATGMETGKNAFDLYRQTSMATTGPRGIMRAAGMFSDPVISKLGRDSRQALFNIPIDQLTPDNPAIIAMAAEANTTPQGLIDAQNKITSKSANLFKNSDTATQKLKDVLKKYNQRSATGMEGPLSPQVRAEMTQALGESNIAQTKEHPELGQNQRLASQYSEGIARNDAQMQNKALEDAKKQQLQGGVTGRPEDETNRVQAEASRLANEMFVSMKDSIVPASDAVKVFIKDINTLVSVMKSGSSDQRTRAIQDFQNMHSGPTTQSTAGPPLSGTGTN